MNDSNLQKAYHEKQVAYDEMIASREKMFALKQALMLKNSEAEKLQAEYEDSRAKQDESWKEYNDAQLKLKEQIGDILSSINECNKLAETLSQTAQKPDEKPAVAKVYTDGAKFFASMAKRNIVERDRLLALKRNAPRPDNHQSRQILDALKNVRAEIANVSDDYHGAKNEFTAKRQNFERLNEEFKALRNNANAEIVHTNQPKKLENNEGLLVKFNIPKEYWDSCTMKERTDGRIDIYYGSSDQTYHGHAIISGDQIEYNRLPQTVNI